MKPFAIPVRSAPVTTMLLDPQMVQLTVGADEATASTSFFDRPGVEMAELPIGPGVPLGIESVTQPELRIGGAYGAWGEAVDNARLPGIVESFLGQALPDAYRLCLSDLGFDSRHHTPVLSNEDHVELEVEVGARLLRGAAEASGWEPGEVDAVLLGMSVPAADNIIARMANKAGIPEHALKVTLHKGCDGSVGGLQLALNPGLSTFRGLGLNVAQMLYGKRVLVGGIEGLSRIISVAQDPQAIQLFGTAGGVIGIIPGDTMRFLAGCEHEVYDEDGLLQVHMYYPHSGQRVDGESMIEVSQTDGNTLLVAGLLHEPPKGAGPVVMGRGGLVKFFVRNGVGPVQAVYRDYRAEMANRGTPERQIEVIIAHHANLKINQLKAKTLEGMGITAPMPWVLSDFGNVSAASPMIAFLRCLPDLQCGDHMIFDGFGAGTYYDVVAVELGE